MYRLRRLLGASRPQKETSTGAWHVVFEGVIGVTFFGLFLTPVFYTVIRNLTGDKPIPISEKGKSPPVSPSSTPA